MSRTVLALVRISVTIQRLACLCDVQAPAVVDFDQPIIQTILRYTANRSEKRNDLQIEQISFAGRPGGPPQFLLAPVLEYQYGRGELTLHSADPMPPRL